MRRAWVTSSLGTISAALLAAALVTAGPAFAADSTVTVTKDGDGGWAFNPSPSNATPYTFSTDAASTGNGSLYVEPIGPTAAHKFIAGKLFGTSVSDFGSLSYDFLIAGDGVAPADASQFYLNVYANFPESDPTKFYDCRFDYVASTGSTAAFTTATVGSGTAPNLVARSSTSPRPTCPATLGEMADGSIIRAVSLNLGDTSSSDSGLAGYFDNVVITTTAGSTAYDFEDRPASKDECKGDGWMRFDIYKNQGECIAWVNSPKG